MDSRHGRVMAGLVFLLAGCPSSPVSDQPAKLVMAADGFEIVRPGKGDLFSFRLSDAVPLDGRSAGSYAQADLDAYLKLVSDYAGRLRLESFPDEPFPDPGGVERAMSTRFSLPFQITPLWRPHGPVTGPGMFVLVYQGDKAVHLLRNGDVSIFGDINDGTVGTLGYAFDVRTAEAVARQYFPGVVSLVGSDLERITFYPLGYAKVPPFFWRIKGARASCLVGSDGSPYVASARYFTDTSGNPVVTGAVELKRITEPIVESAFGPSVPDGETAQELVSQLPPYDGEGALGLAWGSTFETLQASRPEFDFPGVESATGRSSKGELLAAALATFDATDSDVRILEGPTGFAVMQGNRFIGLLEVLTEEAYLACRSILPVRHGTELSNPPFSLLRMNNVWQIGNTAVSLVNGSSDQTHHGIFLFDIRAISGKSDPINPPP